MTEPVKLGGQAIGAAGELLVQYKPIKRGIDSARLTTDSGIDLVMYVPGTSEALTVQVKAIVNPFLDGGTGPLVAGWVFPRTCKAQWLAGVDNLARSGVAIAELKTHFVMHAAIRQTYGRTSGWNCLAARWSASKATSTNTISTLSSTSSSAVRNLNCRKGRQPS